jgi:hypothetical protein
MVEFIESAIDYDYVTISLTQSRIKKGLLSIPVSLIENFPKKKTKVHVFFDDKDFPVERNFTPYESSSRECRIGGMKEFYEKNNMKEGDETVIQFLGENRYRILSEHKFKLLVNKYENEFDASESEQKAEEKIKSLAMFTNTDKKTVIASEFLRLSRGTIEPRKYREQRPARGKESAPHSVRQLLAEVYGGKCQLTDFTFLMKNGKPYFEIHHIRPAFGDHLKNLLVVSPNVHAQFEYANVEERFDEDGWLRTVRFNAREFIVKQCIDNVKIKFSKEIHLLDESNRMWRKSK